MFLLTVLVLRGAGPISLDRFLASEMFRNLFWDRK